MSKLLCRIWIIFVYASGVAFAADKMMSAGQLLEKARNSKQQATFAKFHGTMQHRRKGHINEKHELYFGLLLQKERIIGQLVVDDESGYILGQSRLDGSSTLQTVGKYSSVLDRVGVKASDFALGFLYYPLSAEVGNEMYKMVIRCRVLKLFNQEKKENILVWLADPDAFPLKAEFYHQGETKPYRTLETDGFCKKNNLYYAGIFRIYGDGWRTKIEFDAKQVDLGFYKKNDPPKIIRNLKNK